MITANTCRKKGVRIRSPGIDIRMSSKANGVKVIGDRINKVGGSSNSSKRNMFIDENRSNSRKKSINIDDNSRNNVIKGIIRIVTMVMMTEVSKDHSVVGRIMSDMSPLIERTIIISPTIKSQETGRHVHPTTGIVITMMIVKAIAEATTTTTTTTADTIIITAIISIAGTAINDRKMKQVVIVSVASTIRSSFKFPSVLDFSSI